MKKKVLKNIPRPDKDKMAIFYGRSDKPSKDEVSTADKKATVDKRTTVDKSPTVDKMSAVVNEDLLKDHLQELLTRGFQEVYIRLFRRSYGQGKETTDWVGYGELSRESKISLKTIQRAIATMIDKHLIEKTDFINEGERKGSKYRVLLPPGLNLPTVDKMSTVDKEGEE